MTKKVVYDKKRKVIYMFSDFGFCTSKRTWMINYYEGEPKNIKKRIEELINGDIREGIFKKTSKRLLMRENMAL